MNDDLRGEDLVENPGIDVVGPDHPSYDEVRQVWNAMIDQRPALIHRCRFSDEVSAALAVARDRGLAVSIRGGGHNIAGSAVRDDALMIDLSPMRQVTVDPAARTARVEGGATLADLDRAAQAHGLAVPAGVVSDTGVSGLTLGGGFGWLSRRFGLAADNLEAVAVVLADGRLVRASADEEPELFWALRGGSGNFGVAVGFEFRLHSVGPDVLFGPTFYWLDDAPRVLRAWADFMADAPRECCIWADMAAAPPAPFLPEEVHGQTVLILLSCWSGDPAAGEAVLARLGDFAPPLGSWLVPRPYVEAQKFLDQTYAKGARNYWGTENHTTLTDAAIDALVNGARRLPSAESDVLIAALGGAVDDVAADASAYPHRGVRFVSAHGARWRDAAQDDDMIAWVRAVSENVSAHASEGAYVNFIAERSGREFEAYGLNAARLAVAKARYDPTNLFRVNQNVKPDAHPSE